MKAIQTITLATAILFGAFTVIAQTWTQTGAPTNLWDSISCSADGKNLIAANNFGSLYFSTNYGVTWVEATNGETDGNWVHTGANSADGSVLGAADFISGVWLSDDSGATWNLANLPSQGGWTALAMSKDGNRIIAARYTESVAFAHSDPPNPGLIYISSDSGKSWVTNSLSAHNWVSAACSADGRVIAITAAIFDYNTDAQYPGQLFVSTNYGGSWFSDETMLENWAALTCSADGSTLLAGTVSSSIYSSTNFGATWLSNSVPDTASGWGSVSMSADGLKWVNLRSNGNAFISTNLGISWFKLDAPSQKNWNSVAMSADGNRLFAAAYWDGIYTAYFNPSPALDLHSVGNQPALSWTMPATNFVLQQSTDMVHWIDVTNPALLNFTNLHNEVTLPPPSGNAFFRLKTP
jgi:hypothetical protein